MSKHDSKLDLLVRKLSLLKRDEIELAKKLQDHRNEVRELKEDRSLKKKFDDKVKDHGLIRDLRTNLEEQKKTDKSISRINLYRSVVVKESGMEKVRKFVEFATDARKALEFAKALNALSPNPQYTEDLKKAMLAYDVTIESAVEIPSMERIQKVNRNPESKREDRKGLVEKYKKDIRKESFRARDVEKGIRIADKKLLKALNVTHDDNPKLNGRQQDRERRAKLKKELGLRYGEDVQDQIEKARNKAAQQERQRQQEIERKLEEEKKKDRSR